MPASPPRSSAPWRRANCWPPESGKPGFRLGTNAALAIDVAASEFHDPASRTYELAAEQRVLTAVELTEELRSWAADFPIVSIEDPLAEDDWEHWPGAPAALAGV